MIGDFLDDISGHHPVTDHGLDRVLGHADGSAVGATTLDWGPAPTAVDPVAGAAAEPVGGGVLQGVGDPAGDAAHWHYQGPESACAVVSQGSIIEALTGQPFDQHAATSWLQENHWYDPATGTRPEDLHRLLDAYKIPNSSGSTDLAGLWDALAAGDKVVVTLDANEIWTPAHDPATGAPVEQIQPAGHAVWLTGLQQDASGTWQVVLNDSGKPDGRAETVALADFVNAWDDYGNYAVVAGGHAVAATGAGPDPAGRNEVLA